MGCGSSKNNEPDTGSETLNFSINTTKGICPAGEKAGSTFMDEGKIPVLSCEGPCIRGEIARLAANAVSKAEGFARACHGETFTVPHSAMARWVRNSPRVIVIDGCFLKCHGRILESIVDAKSLVEFDAYSFYKKYADYFEIDSVPEEERKNTARQVADDVLRQLKDEKCAKLKSSRACGCEVEA